MDIEIYRKVDREVAQDIYRLAELMVEAGACEKAVFLMILSFVSGGLGMFFIVREDGKNVAYGSFTYGVNVKEFRRLEHFAVEPDYRRKGLGKKALSIAISEVVDMEAGCSLVCSSKLERFYKTMGFRFKMLPEKGGKDVVMLLSRKNVQLTKNHQFYKAEIDLKKAAVDFPRIKVDLGIAL